MTRRLGESTRSALYDASRDVFTNTVTESACGVTVTSLSRAGSVWAPLSVGTSSIRDRKSTRLNSSHPSISYAVFCLKKKKRSYQIQHGIDPLINTHYQTAGKQKDEGLLHPVYLCPYSSVVYGGALFLD